MGDDNKNAPVSWKVGEIILGDFRIERVLGKGGMGTVYLVLDQHNGLHYAAKRTHFMDDESRTQFLREMRVWLDLPQHPHVLPLRFFRTIGEEHVIFTDYMEGGSLQKRLGTESLSRMEALLDLAIQYAWGLHALHELGQVHQDVKPGNALLDGKGILKVADFGLMRVRRAVGTSKIIVHKGGKGTHGVTYAGHTDAYCSPEQWREQERLTQDIDRPAERITRHTDTWSWGLSVLAMFYGEDPPYNGPNALEVLEALQANPIQNPFGWILELPAAVADILRRCFQETPTDRWPSLLEAADALVDLYPSLCGGQRYPRAKPTFMKASDRVKHDHDRRVGGVQWHDPFDWLKIAFLADGRDPTEVDRSNAPQTISRKGQATGDLALYEEAYRILNRLVQSGSSELEEQLAVLCVQKAFIYEYLDDFAGRLRMYDRTIAILQRLVKQEGRRELENNLAITFMNNANALNQMGQLSEAVAAYDQAIAIYQRLVDQEGRRELEPYLANALMNKAIVLKNMGQLTEAVEHYDQAIAIYKRLVEQEGRRELEPNLATTLMNKANTFQSMGQLTEAVHFYDQAIAIYKRLVEQEGRRELEPNLATALMNKAIVLKNMGQLTEAVALYDQGIAIRQRLVDGGQRHLANELAHAHRLRDQLLSQLNDSQTVRAPPP